MDHRAIGDRDAGTDHHKGFDRHLVAERRIGGEVDGFRRDHRHAGLECCLAQPRLHDVLGFGELGLGVDAAHFILAGLDHNGLQSKLTNDANRVAQIILALAVGIPDFFDDFQRPAAVECHDAGIAEFCRAFGRRRVGVLADRHQPVTLDQQPAVAGGIGGLKAEHGQCCPVFQQCTHARECRGRNQRRIAEHDQQVVGAAGDGIADREHRVRGAETLALNEGRRIRSQTFDLLRDSQVVRSDHDGERGAGALWGGFKHMRQQRLAGDGMQDLRHR